MRKILMPTVRSIFFFCVLILQNAKVFTFSQQMVRKFIFWIRFHDRFSGDTQDGIIFYWGFRSFLRIQIAIVWAIPPHDCPRPGTLKHYFFSIKIGNVNKIFQIFVNFCMAEFTSEFSSTVIDTSEFFRLDAYKKTVEFVNKQKLIRKDEEEQQVKLEIFLLFFLCFFRYPISRLKFYFFFRRRQSTIASKIIKIWRPATMPFLLVFLIPIQFNIPCSFSSFSIITSSSCFYSQIVRL